MPAAGAVPAAAIPSRAVRPTADPAKPMPVFLQAACLSERLRSTPEAHATHMRARLSEVAVREVGEFWVDYHMRNIPDHWHAHARPRGGFFGVKTRA